ncbi:septation protein IspZ [Hyphobacterium sp. HN65]|uniref:Inner membrane-spanning protein YciB n=1 Tax=Hyphobacterium lacteum TaxID=3116575 RepID=A0ABU7LTT2_9PROT|nr:septation protein IspZ [Hyphobacterium sp. HN65]MEE2526754.1 septation protein IspZ [Hyphobacterium sp. HN65]
MSQARKTAGQGAQLLTDVGPVIVFILFYNVGRNFVGDAAIYWATGAFMLATTAALAFAAIVQKRFPPMLVVTAVIVLSFGGLTIWLQDPIFVYIKPTIINLIFSFAILISFAFGFNVWKAIFGSVFHLPERIWWILAIRWSLFFQFLALLNELLWRHINDSIVPESARWFAALSWNESLWANMKLGVMAITFAFAMANIPILLRHQIEDEEKSADRPGSP